MRLAAHEAAAVDHVGEPLEDGPQQQLVLARVVFEIGVLDDEVLAGGATDAGVQRGPFPLIDLVPDHRHRQLRMGVPVRLEHRLRVVLRAVVDDDQFLAEPARELRLADAIEDTMDGPRLVVGGNDNRQLRHEAVLYRTARYQSSRCPDAGTVEQSVEGAAIGQELRSGDPQRRNVAVWRHRRIRLRYGASVSSVTVTPSIRACRWNRWLVWTSTRLASACCGCTRSSTTASPSQMHLTPLRATRVVCHSDEGDRGGRARDGRGRPDPQLDHLVAGRVARRGSTRQGLVGSQGAVGARHAAEQQDDQGGHATIVTHAGRECLLTSRPAHVQLFTFHFSLFPLWDRDRLHRRRGPVAARIGRVDADVVGARPDRAAQRATRRGNRAVKRSGDHEHVICGRRAARG